MADNVETHNLIVEKTARYYVARPDGEVRWVLYAIHGYRQLGKYFIKRFMPLTERGVLVIVPEGLHRFYIEGYDGRVGASWMTKEDRLTDIKDYVNYLNRLHETLAIDRSIPIDLLGFSQGGPTACRWLAQSTIPFKRLILHSTVFPNDFDFDQQRERLTRIESIALFGDADQFAPEVTIEKKMKWMADNDVKPDLIRFKGGHEIHLASLQSLYPKGV